MSLILSIETSTAVCSVALHQQGNLLSVMEVHQEYSHASRLGPLVADLMKAAELKITKLEAIAVSSGPGSYTGLRIGTSLAKGLCYALDLPLIAVPTLTILASAVSRLQSAEVFLCPMIDARRMEVYCQVFDQAMQEYEPVKSEIVDERSFEKYLDLRPVIFFGNGAPKCRGIIAHENAKFLDDVNPSAAQLGILAFSKFQAGAVESLFDFVPHYLKEFFFKRKAEALNEIR
ncbi:MAG TPA: tRNA (adenosine(37)-N6)-threonylcarbamoyltransferase complex dimerization subunit type 1 TsaB [Chryseolinea sp.]